MTEAVPSLRRNFLWSFAGNVAFGACLWGMLVILTKLGTTEDVGRFALASAVATPLLVFANLQLRQLVVTDTRGDHQFRDYLGVRVMMLPIALCLLAIIAGIGYRGPQAATILIYGTARTIEGLSDILYGQAQKRERLDMVAISMIIKGTVSLALFAGLFWLTRSLTWALAALPIGWAVPLLFYDIPRCRGLLAGQEPLRPRWRWSTMRSIIWVALPLGLVMLLIQLRHTVPRTMLEQARGESELGIFAALAYVIIVGNTVVMALSQAGIARLARAWAVNDASTFRRTVFRLVTVGLVMGLTGLAVAVFLSDIFLGLLYSREYAQHRDLFVLVMAAGGAMYIGSLLGAPATAMRAFRAQLWIHIVNSLLLLLAGAFLIPRLGMMGAGWTVLIGAIWVAAAYGAVVVKGMNRMRSGPTKSKGTA